MNNDEINEIGKVAATISIVELGLGSLLHTFKIPLSGHILSVNQITILTRSTFKLKSRTAALKISIISSILKSLSPSGKKLTPMLAIAAQGVMYSFGIFLGGINYFGLFLAVAFSSLWAFVQPLLFLWVLFGNRSITIAEHFLGEIHKFFPNADHYILSFLIGSLLLKLLFCYGLSIYILRLTDVQFETIQNKFSLSQSIKPPRSIDKSTYAYLALRDLLSPLFIFSLMLTCLFFYFSHSPRVEIIWGLLRPIGFGFIIFYFTRRFPIEKMTLYLEKKGLTQLSKMIKVAMNHVNRSKKP